MGLGKRPVRVYELLGDSGTTISEDMTQALDKYGAGLGAYREQCWQEALDHFQEVQGLWPEDRASIAMVERCRIYQKTPPGAGWDGVFQQMTK